MTLLVPTAATLEKYGLTVEAWQQIADRQGRVCAVCRKLPASGRLCVDHRHVPKYKKLPPAERASHVRGLVCYQDNHALLRRGMTPERLRSAADYLERT